MEDIKEEVFNDWDNNQNVEDVREGDKEGNYVRDIVYLRKT